MTKPSSSLGAATRTRAATPAFAPRARAAELRLIRVGKAWYALIIDAHASPCS